VKIQHLLFGRHLPVDTLHAVVDVAEALAKDLDHVGEHGDDGVEFFALDFFMPQG
jgi:hypothetical protein